MEKSPSICPFKCLIDVLKTDFRGKLLKTILPVVLIALLCLPWGIRNYRIHKTIVPVCTIAGWHIASNGSFDMKLSLKFLTDHIYAPKHRGFNEGDYFVLGRRMFFDAFMDHPVKLPFFGFVRLVRGWSPPSPWWRIVLPKAYLFPIQIGKGIIVPLPDFEGFIYIFIFANIAVFLFAKRLRKVAAKVLFRTSREFRGIFLWLAGYALAHVIGIPLIAYRFIIEPVFIVFGVTLILGYWRCFRESRDSGESDLLSTSLAQTEPVDRGTKAYVAILAVFAILFNLFLIIPAFHLSFNRTCDYAFADYPSDTTPKALDYAALRELQWKQLGNVPKGTRIVLAGMLVYGAPGFRFDSNEYNPVKSAKFASARLRVRYDSPGNPLGVGDVRLNFKRDELLPDGEFVKVYGTVETGPFKELIVNVEMAGRKSSIHFLNTNECR
jgi:hypothetical protein